MIPIRNAYFSDNQHSRKKAKSPKFPGNKKQNQIGFYTKFENGIHFRVIWCFFVYFPRLSVRFMNFKGILAYFGNFIFSSSAGQ